MLAFSSGNKKRTDEINDIFNRCKTDKEGHGYAPIYSLISTNICSLLEIGVADFPSMRAWLEVFPKANITGLDIEIKKHRQFDHERLTCIETDVNKFKPKKEDSWDLIVDDGSHEVPDIIAGWRTLKTQCNGWYVIEDVKFHLVQKILDAVYEENSREKLVHVIQVRSTTHYDADDRVIVIQFEEFYHEKL